MFGLSFEHLMVIAIVLLLFGARKLPMLGQSLGQAMRNFKNSMDPEEIAQSPKEDLKPGLNADKSEPPKT